MKMNQMKKVGDILQEARQDKLLNYEDVSNQTKINPRYLKALEEGDYSAFGSEVHLKGFLKTYAKFLELDVEEVMAFFRREYRSEGGNGKYERFVKPINTPKFVITPALLISVVVVFLVTAFFGYLFFEYRTFAGAPVLIVEQPIEDKVNTPESTINLVGRTDPDAVVTVNGQKISLGEAGVFSTTVTLSDGLNVLNIVSTNKLGKERTITKTIVVEGQETPEEEQVAGAEKVSEAGLEMRVEIGPGAAWMEVYSDGQKSFDGLLAAGVSQEFKAQHSIRVLSGNAGSTKVFLNGEDKGSLGEEGEVVEKVFGEVSVEEQEEATPSAQPQDQGLED